jgi:serine O-acetyltransferase
MIFHYGSIIVNANAKIGDYSIIYPGVVIGATNTGCPTIGQHCFIGAGSKIMGGKNW